jgi:hypothetical protein
MLKAGVIGVGYLGRFGSGRRVRGFTCAAHRLACAEATELKVYLEIRV